MFENENEDDDDLAYTSSYSRASAIVRFSTPRILNPEP